jgi:hypothetical protein
VLRIAILMMVESPKNLITEGHKKVAMIPC